MRTVKVKQIDVFTNNAFSGNPAGVVSEAEILSKEEMQLIACEMSLSETAFIVKPSRNSDADYGVRFFTPKNEVDLCGHATIATVHALAEEGNIFLREPTTTISLETNAGNVPAEIHFTDSKIKKIMMTQPKLSYSTFEEKTAEVLTALRIDESEVEQFHSPEHRYPRNYQLKCCSLPWSDYSM